MWLHLSIDSAIPQFLLAYQGLLPHKNNAFQKCEANIVCKQIFKEQTIAKYNCYTLNCKFTLQTM